jgi:ABC-type lipoprotein release transport system permease subunit
MFLTYLHRELRHRMRQTVLIALALAVGIGLVITVTAVSSGLESTQGRVLNALYGVGADITVTRARGAGPDGPPGAQQPGEAGGERRPAQNRLLSARLGLLSASSVDSLARLPGVRAAAGGLALTELRVARSARPGAKTGLGETFTAGTLEVTGVEPTAGAVGPLARARTASGRTFTAADADAAVAVVDSRYAQQESLHVGATTTLAGSPFTVIGIVVTRQGTAPAAVYLPLRRAQRLAGLAGQVNTIYVTAASGTRVADARREISTLLPTASVTTPGDLADQITGSLASAASLADRLGTWLAAAVLAAAFLTACLLTTASVSRRVRELGTLKALGWTGHRITGQVMGESMVTSLLGGVAGVALGYGGAALITRLMPSLTVSPGQGAGSAAANPGGTVSVDFAAPVAADTIALAVAMAIVGGLIAGLLGGWRAARLRPAMALTRLD